MSHHKATTFRSGQSLDILLVTDAVSLEKKVCINGIIFALTLVEEAHVPLGFIHNNPQHLGGYDDFVAICNHIKMAIKSINVDSPEICYSVENHHENVPRGRERVLPDAIISVQGSCGNPLGARNHEDKHNRPLSAVWDNNLEHDTWKKWISHWFRTSMVWKHIRPVASLSCKMCKHIKARDDNAHETKWRLTLSMEKMLGVFVKESWGSCLVDIVVELVKEGTPKVRRGRPRDEGFKVEGGCLKKGREGKCGYKGKGEHEKEEDE
ncbi:hypothetical protein VNO78_28970 [Psophocarpus tetragonolobus]|uniref:Uncharacterized protein n=1 Tax=Psophocarpus tetragonolobus TaxID=3891 RepID=A0AAN9X235_PSOTE